MAAINEVNKPKVVRSAKAYVARAKKETVVLPPPPPKPKTNEEIVAALGLRSDLEANLLHHLNNNLQALRGLQDYTTGRAWDRENLIAHFVAQNKLAMERAAAEERRLAELAERRKNWNPSEAEKLNFMKTHMGLREKMTRPGRYDDSFCTCCGCLHVNYPGMDGYQRMRWEVVADGVQASAKHNTESLRIKDAETGKDMIISWENA